MVVNAPNACIVGVFSRVTFILDPVVVKRHWGFSFINGLRLQYSISVVFRLDEIVVSEQLVVFYDGLSGDASRLLGVVSLFNRAFAAICGSLSP